MVYDYRLYAGHSQTKWSSNCADYCFQVRLWTNIDTLPTLATWMVEVVSPAGFNTYQQSWKLWLACDSRINGSGISAVLFPDTCIMRVRCRAYYVRISLEHYLRICGSQMLVDAYEWVEEEMKLEIYSFTAPDHSLAEFRHLSHWQGFWRQQQ